MSEYVFVIVILATIGATVFKWWYNSPRQKGKRGEMRVYKKLLELTDEYYIFNDVILDTGQGTTQIDHIVASIYGIFIIEVKNYKGWILGSENGREWTQSIYGHKNKFMNPIHQNYGHVKAIEALLNNKGITNVPIIPIVTFPGDATIKITCDKALVVKWGQLKETIIKHSTTAVLTKDEMSNIVDLLGSSNIDSKETRKKHISNIHKKEKEEKGAVSQGICPKCGGSLIPKNGKYGSFYGCSNYPKCRYTKKI